MLVVLIFIICSPSLYALSLTTTKHFCVCGSWIIPVGITHLFLYDCSQHQNHANAQILPGPVDPYRICNKIISIIALQSSSSCTYRIIIFCVRSQSDNLNNNNGRRWRVWNSQDLNSLHWFRISLLCPRVVCSPTIPILLVVDNWRYGPQSQALLTVFENTGGRPCSCGRTNGLYQKFIPCGWSERAQSFWNGGRWNCYPVAWITEQHTGCIVTRLPLTALQPAVALLDVINELKWYIRSAATWRKCCVNAILPHCKPERTAGADAAYTPFILCIRQQSGNCHLCAERGTFNIHNSLCSLHCSEPGSCRQWQSVFGEISCIRCNHSCNCEIRYNTTYRLIQCCEDAGVVLIRTTCTIRTPGTNLPVIQRIWIQTGECYIHPMFRLYSLYKISRSTNVISNKKTVGCCRCPIQFGTCVSDILLLRPAGTLHTAFTSFEWKKNMLMIANAIMDLNEEMRRTVSCVFWIKFIAVLVPGFTAFDLV